MAHACATVLIPRCPDLRPGSEDGWRSELADANYFLNVPSLELISSFSIDFALSVTGVGNLGVGVTYAF